MVPSGRTFQGDKPMSKSLLTRDAAAMDDSPAVCPRQRLRRLLVLRTCFVCLVIAAGSAAAEETPKRSSQQVGASLRAYVPSGLGLDVIQRRAVNDPWVLYDQSTYERGGGDTRLAKYRQAVAKAREQRRPGEVQVAVDVDEDGKPDWWVFFAEDAPAFAETDLYGAGCRDMRLDLRQEPVQVREFRHWATEPPVPLGAPDAAPIKATVLYDWSAPASRTESDTPLQGMALLRFPDLPERLAALAKKTEDKATVDRLSSYRDKALRLYPKMVEIHRSEDLARKLQFRGGAKVTYRPFGLDGGPGTEVAVGFAPWGIDSIEFYRNGWKGGTEEGPGGPKKQKDFLAQVFFDRGRVYRVDLQEQRHFLISGFWARVRPEARRTIAEKFLLPGYRDFRAGDWYQAVSRWRAGVQLAALMGDLRLDQQCQPAGGLDRFSAAAWNFTVEDLGAGSLLRIALATASRHEFPSFTSLAQDSVARGRFEDALELYRLSLRFAEKGGDVVWKVHVLDDMSGVYRRLGNYDRAIECLFQSLDLESSLGYAFDVIENVKLLSHGFDETVDAQVVMQMRSHAMAVNRACKLGTIASLCADLGEREKAERYLAEAERLAEPLGHKYVDADLLNLKAKLDLADRRWDLGLQRLRRALAIEQDYAADQQKEDEGRRLYERGSAMHLFTLAKPRYFYRVGLASSTHPLSYQALTAGMIGEAYLQQATDRETSGEAARQELVKQAKQWQDRALQWYEKAGDSAGVLVTRLRLATIAASERKYDEALKLAASARQESGQEHLFEIGWRALALEGAVYRSRRQTQEAIKAYEQAAKAIESLRARMYSEPIRRAFFESKIDVYEQLALLYLNAGDEQAGPPDGQSGPKVWQCMERAKARTLLDIVAGQPLEIKGAEVAQASKEQPLLFPQMRGAAAEMSQRDPLLREDEYERHLAAVADRPLLQEVVSLGCVSPVQWKAVAGLLEPGHLLIEYFATEQDLLAAVMSQHDLKIVRIAGYGSEALRRDVEAFRQAIQEPTGRYELPAKRLYGRLLAPCLAGRQGVRHLCIVPGGALYYLPFGALMLPDGRFLVQCVPVSYAPSASALVYAIYRKRERGQDGPNQTLVVADPVPPPGFQPLPAAADEGKSIFGMAPEPKRLLSGKAATESLVVAQLPSTRYFHFAGHTHLPCSSPMRAGLLCTEDVEADGRLEVREVFGLNLRGCEMVTLSACETRLGRYSRGDEIVGLERAFLRAGVPTVVASLWKVDDAATDVLMVEFYRNLWSKDKKLGKLEALRQAQLAMLRGELKVKVDETRRRRGLRGPVLDDPKPLPKGKSIIHPCYWAAFLVSGDWR